MPIPAVIHCTSTAVIFPLLPKLSPVLNRAGQDVGDGFDAAMWMPGKSGRVIVEVIVTEIVQQEKWIEFPGLAEADGALQFDARAFDDRFGSIICFRFHESAGASNNAAHSDRLVSERCHEACHLVS